MSAEVYGLMARGLLPPGADVCSGQWAAELGRALGAEVPGSLGAARSAGQALEEYRATFGPPAPLLCPIESCYKPWTTLAGAALPMANQKGWLGGDSAAHLRALFRELGVTVPPEYTHAPDHLALELEFMGILAEEGTPELCELYRRQHLDWVGELAREAQEKGAPPFYQDLLGLIARVVAA